MRVVQDGGPNQRPVKLTEISFTFSGLGRLRSLGISDLVEMGESLTPEVWVLILLEGQVRVSPSLYLRIEALF